MPADRYSYPRDYEETRTQTVRHQMIESDTPARKAVHGVPVPEDVELKDGRCSQAQRNRIEDHLTNLCAEGYIPENELSQRLAHAHAAVTIHELNMLISDLPAMPAPKRNLKEDKPPETLRERLGKPRAENAIMILLLIATGAGLGILPWVLIGGPKPTQFAYAVAAACTLAGVAAIIGGIIWAASAFDNN